jgi:hypothetical protein
MKMRHNIPQKDNATKKLETTHGDAPFKPCTS